jgi:hypothetical protein
MTELRFINYKGIVDTGNSSSTPLGGGAVFTGTSIDVLNYAIIAINVTADQASATNGLSVQQSSDGTNWDHDDSYTISAGIAKNFTVQPYAQYMRVVYTNGAVAQTAFRLQVILKSVNIKPSSHKTSETISTEDDCELQKSIMMTKADDLDTYRNVGINYPVPVTGMQLYPNDVNITYSDMNTFSGSPTDLLDDRWTTVVDDTAANPKIILLEFERPMQTSVIGLATISGSFSNTIIKYGLLGSSDVTLLDESADATAKTLLLAPSTPITLTRIQLEFHTANTITLSAVNLAKSRQSISQIQGVDEDGNIVNFEATRQGNFKISVHEYGDTPSIDAFDRLRVSEPFTIFDSKQLHDKQPLFWDETTGGSATSTHDSANACVEMVVTASATDYVIRQTKQQFNYQPGKGQLILFTFFADRATGVTMKAGIFSGTGVNYLTPNNGIFLEIDDTDTISWNIAKNGSTTETHTQANWNVDPMDGTGPSGLTLDLDATQIGIIDFEALLVGRVRCGFVIDGIIRYVTYFNHANDNTFTSAYFSTPNLPLRYQIESDGTSAGQLDHICATVMSEGGVEETGILRSVDTGNTHVDANAADTTYAVVGVRLKSTHLDVTVYPEFMTMISETNDDFKWSLLLNPTIAGTFTYSDVTNSSIQYATGATANIVSAYDLQIDSGYAQSNASVGHKFVTQLRIGSQIDGTRDTLVLCVTPLAANADIQASLTIRELL